MFSLLLLFLVCINVVEITKIEDISICINDTDCSESIDSIIYTHIPEVDDLFLKDLSNETEEDNTFITTIPTEIISSKINATEQPEVQSTLTTISSRILHPSDNEILTLEKKEICECDLIVCTNINIFYTKYRILLDERKNYLIFKLFFLSSIL